jgi:hypothetical protein
MKKSWRPLYEGRIQRMRAEYSEHATLCVVRCPPNYIAKFLAALDTYRNIGVRYLPLLRSRYKNLPLCLIIYICLSSSSWYCLPRALRWVNPIDRGNTGNVGLTSTIVSSYAQNAPQHGVLPYTMRLDLDMSRKLTSGIVAKHRQAKEHKKPPKKNQMQGEKPSRQSSVMQTKLLQLTIITIPSFFFGSLNSPPWKLCARLEGSNHTSQYSC